MAMMKMRRKTNLARRRQTRQPITSRLPSSKMRISHIGVDDDVAGVFRRAGDVSIPELLHIILKRSGCSPHSTIVLAWILC